MQNYTMVSEFFQEKIGAMVTKSRETIHFIAFSNTQIFFTFF